MYTLNIFGNLFCRLWGIHVHNISFLVPDGSSLSDGTKTVKDWTHYDYRTVDLLFILTFHTNHSHKNFSSSIVEQSGSFTHTHTHTLSLRALLSGTFLQTLSDLVTPLKGHSLSLRTCPPMWSAPSERFGY